MAKRRNVNPPLSETDKTIYDIMPPDEQQRAMGITDPAARSTYIQNWAIAQQVAQTGGGTGLPSFTPGVVAAGTDQTYFEQALGTQTGRRVTTAGQPVAGSAVPITGPAATPIQELRGLGTRRYTPRYYERDADLINTFGYERIAEVQQKLVKAGLLTDKYALGRVDSATRKAWVDLLEQANRIPSPDGQTSVDWTTALEIVSTQKTAGGTGKLPPKVSNPADITKIVQQVAGKVLGRSANQQTVDAIVRQFQASQVATQTNTLPMADGRRVEPMDLQTLAEQKIMKRQGAEAEAYRFAQFASRLFGEASEGVPSEMGQVQP